MPKTPWAPKDQATLTAKNRRQILIGGTLATSALAITDPAHSAQPAPSSGEQATVGLFTAISATDIPDNVNLITTSGWSAAGVGMARYVADHAVDGDYVRRYPATAAISKNGRGFRLAEPELSALMIGASPQLEDNGPSIQRAIEACSNRGGGQVSIPSGTYRFTTTLQMRSGVDLVGAGKAGSILRYDGAGVAIDAVGTASERRIFHLRDLSLVGSRTNIATTGVQLAWNQRSLPMMERVGIAGFGRYGIEFVGNNWLITFRDVEIHDCGRAVPGGCGIFRRADGKGFEALADIKFFGLVVEACGHPQSQGGAVTFPCTPPFTTQGLWFHGCCIEGNFGGAEMAFERVDFLSIDQSYFEIASEPKNRKDGIHIDGGIANISYCRFTTDNANKQSSAIQARKNGQIGLVGNGWDQDFGYADVNLMTGAQLNDYPPIKVPREDMRVVIDPI